MPLNFKDFAKMPSFMRPFFGFVLAAGLGLTAPVNADDDRQASDLLPSTTVIFAEVPAVPDLVDGILQHPIRHRFESLDEVKAAYEKKEFLDFKAGVAVVESQLGMPWTKIVKQVSGGGITAAVDAKTQGAVLLFKAQDEQIAPKLLATLENLAKLDAANKGRPNPIETVEYRGLKAYSISKARVAVAGPWMIVTNKDDLAKWIGDCYLDKKTSETLTSNKTFQEARAKQQATNPSGKQVAWGWIQTGVLREAGLAKKVYSGKADNAVAELLFGGILSTLKNTPYVTAAITTAPRQASLTFSAPFDRSWAGEAREYFFGPGGTGKAPAPLAVNNPLLVLRAYRDISGMWLRAGDLFDEKANEELAKADSNLSTLFGGKDFGEDILGSFAPELQLIVVRQEFTDGKPQPAIKLPAFSFVFELKDPEKMQPELRRTFQSLIGFLNIVGAMNGQPQLELDMEKQENLQVVSASYLLDAKQKDPTGLKLHYNFSPSIAFSGSRIAIASTKELARELALAKAATGDESKANANDKAEINTDARVNVAGIASVLNDNRGHLIAQNMLEKGHTKDEAEKEIDMFLELVSWVESGGIQMSTTENELRLSVSLSVTDLGQ